MEAVSPPLGTVTPPLPPEHSDPPWSTVPPPPKVQ